MINLFALNKIKCQKIFFNRITFLLKIYFLELKILEKKSKNKCLFHKTNFKNLILWKIGEKQLK